MKRWHHGHSIGTGLLMGMLLTRHPFLLFGGGVAVGVALAYVRQSAAWFAQKVQHWRDHGPSKREQIITEPIPVYSTRVPRASSTRRGGDIPY
jgi:hypothetical protein